MEQQNGNAGIPSALDGPQKNFPPVPPCCPFTACYYQNIDEEIPERHRATVKMIYGVYVFYVLALVFNCFASFFYMLYGGGSISQAFWAIIQLGLFSPCGYVFWFRPVYKAFKNDSSLWFMIFFFILSLHTFFTLIQALGLSSYACGWINALEAFRYSTPVACLMLCSAIALSISFGGMLISLITVHKIYRGSNFSMEKAKEEYKTGIFGDRLIAASSALRV